MISKVNTRLVHAERLGEVPLYSDELPNETIVRLEVGVWESQRVEVLEKCFRLRAK